MEIYKMKDIGFDKITHLAIPAHQDDIEFMAYQGILECFMKYDKQFGAVVVTNGSGSPRGGIYGEYSDEQMMKLRIEEQKKAAIIGDYAFQGFIGLPSNVVKDEKNRQAVEEIKDIIEKTKPQYIYTHNLADKHDTHVAVVLRVITALRELNYCPEKLYGCEVWRGLDWVNDGEKISFDVSGRPNLESSLLGVFDSQIAGGKRYDSAVIGRRHANATFAQSHGVDNAEEVMFAIDLTPLISDKNLDICGYIIDYIDRFKNSVKDTIESMGK